MSRTNNKKFHLLMEYGLGGAIDHDRRTFIKGRQNRTWCKYDTFHVDISKELGLCNGIRVWNDPSPERVKHAMAGGYSALVDVFSDDGRWKIFADERRQDVNEYFDNFMNYLSNLVKENPDSVWGNRFPEVDNYPWMDWEVDEHTRKGVFERLKKIFSSNDYWLSKPEEEKIISGLNVDGDHLDNPFEYLRKKGMKPQDINMITLYCQMFFPHLLCELGAEVVWPEGNVGTNHQIAIAFARGAAMQYDKKWFYDIAPFSCQCNDVPTAYDSSRKRFSGFPEEYMLSCWLLLYLSGTTVLLFQAGEMMFFIHDRKQQKVELSPLGETAKDFADFTLRKHPERGQTEVPVALMLAEDHGYTSAFYNQARIFWKKLDNDRANGAIEGFFRLAFPGSNETNGYSFDTNKWTPAGSFHKQHPWWHNPGTQEKHSKAFADCIADGFEQNEMLKGFTTTTWGDSFDVITDKADLKTLNRYKAVILLGNVKISDSNREVLRKYVKNGGRILASSSNVTKKDEEMLGLELSGQRKRQFYFSHSVKTGRSFNDGIYDYEPVKLKGAKALIYEGPAWEKHNPIITRNKYGKGEFWFSGIPDYQADNQYDLTWAEPCKEAVDELIRPLLSLNVIGPPIHWILNRAPKGFIIGLFNYTGDNWKGAVKLNKCKRKVQSVRDIWNEKTVKYSYDRNGCAILSTAVAPGEFKIIEVKYGNASIELTKKETGI